ncbi:MAG: TIGR02300 family protein [Pseudobdellovibrionaceae bacterium]
MAQEATIDDPRGLKRICTNCGTRFFDLNKRPIVCPNCSEEFTGEIKIKSRRGRLSPADAPEEDQVTEETEVEEEEDDLVAEEVDEDTVSLEDVEPLDDDEDEDEALEGNLEADLDDDLVEEDLDDDDDLDVDIDEDK